MAWSESEQRARAVDRHREALAEGEYSESLHPRGRGGKWRDVPGVHMSSKGTLHVRMKLTEQEAGHMADALSDGGHRDKLMQRLYDHKGGDVPLTLSHLDRIDYTLADMHDRSGGTHPLQMRVSLERQKLHRAGAT